ncbi:MAG TPA: molybdate ABC transporter substrate-binding protein [Alphaproteobacteria bacterium]|nr:molybdate ABC transporter substrate-binding protein [Alphaproteobacteria bacterium]
MFAKAISAAFPRRTFIIALSLLAVAAVAPARADTLTIFAAASLKNAMDDVQAEWKKEGGSPTTASYASSSTLAKQIEQAAPADIFISADAQWIDYLDKKSLIQPAHDLLGNRLVLIAGKDSTASIDIKPGFDLAKALGDGRLAVGDPSNVPAGIYAKEALTKLGVWASVLAKLAPGVDARAALALVSRGEAPLGIVYETDAKVDPNVKTVAVFPEDSHAPIYYPVAIVKTSKNADATKFVTYLNSPAAQAIFTRYGFAVVK